MNETSEKLPFDVQKLSGGKMSDNGDKPIGKFPADEIQRLAKDVVGNIIGGSSYSPSEVPNWASAIVEQTMSQITKTTGYKYIVTCTVMQKTGTGLQTSALCYWDSSTDGSTTIRWENKTVTVIVQVFGLAI